MLSKSKAVFGLIKRIRDFNSNSFEDRFYAQRITYILQDGFGLNLGYCFDWDLYGPYSTGLAEDMYKVKNTQKLEETEFRFEKKDDIFKEALEFFKKTESNFDQIRLFASMIQANRERLGRNETISKLEKRPAFSEYDLEGAWDTLKKYNLVAE